MVGVIFVQYVYAKNVATTNVLSVIFVEAGLVGTIMKTGIGRNFNVNPNFASPTEGSGRSIYSL